jgi:hypothetical protein
MTKAQIRAIWEKAPGFSQGLEYTDGCHCAVRHVYWSTKRAGSRLFGEAGLSAGRIVVANDAYQGSTQERRDHMIALLDAGKLDA